MQNIISGFKTLPVNVKKHEPPFEVACRISYFYPPTREEVPPLSENFFTALLQWESERESGGSKGEFKI